MSFTQIEPVPFRLNRTQLFVRANAPETFSAAAASQADVILFELEDAVPAHEKPAARRNLLQALGDLDWGEKTVTMRINGLDTPYMYQDLVHVLEGTSERLDLLLIPKVGVPADVYAVDVLVTQLEAASGRRKRLGFELMIETALGMANINAIAAASPRNESLHLGENDYAASIKARTAVVGGPHPDYHVLTDPAQNGSRERHWGDMWHYPVARLVVAARSRGLRPVDGPFHDAADPEGFRQAAQRARVLGCEGKWLNDPADAPMLNKVFSPTAEEVERARRIVQTFEQSDNAGTGTVVLDGKLLFMPAVRQAQSLLQMAERIGG
jgi:malyl-CoA/(S)-citramalyl-CoA lyase